MHFNNKIKKRTDRQTPKNIKRQFNIFFSYYFGLESVNVITH